jgi:hypothetical protein
LHGLDKRLYQDFMRAIELLEECDKYEHDGDLDCRLKIFLSNDKYEHDGDLDCRLKIFLSNTKSFWPIEEMR